MVANSHMKHIINIQYILWAFLLWCAPLLLSAQSFRVEAPPSVAMSERFQIVYIAEGASASDFMAPSMSGFDVLYGPAVTSSYSAQITNGKSSSTQTTSYTYTLMPRKEGSFSIAKATVRMKGRTYASRALTIKVLPPNMSATTADKPGAHRTTHMGSGNIFYRAVVDKTKAYEQEAIAVTFKLYVDPNVGIQNLEDLKLPELDGFISQTVDEGNQAQLLLENYQGHNYRTAVIQRLIVFPQKSGLLQIPSGMIQIAVALPPDDDEDPFFARPTIISRKIHSSPVAINVMPLPKENRPASFNGAVGRFKMNTEYLTKDPKTNDSYNVKVTIQGVGNIKLVQNPTLKFPDTFEVYDPKVDNKIQVGANGVSGTKTIQYFAVPRQVGSFTLPPFEFSYFDPINRAYKTISQPAKTLTVKEGKGGSGLMSLGNSQEDIKMLSKDISYLKANPGNSRPSGIDFTFGLWHGLIYLFLLILAVVAHLVLKKRRNLFQNEVALKHKRANNVARKRLREAEKLLHSGNQEAFVSELLRALWGYLGDKFKMSMSQLNRSNVEAILREKGVDDALIHQLLNVIDETEFARYAPSSEQSARDTLFTDAAEVIGGLEDAKL